MVQHLLAIDDVKDDFEAILKWAIEFKRLWKQGDEVALNFLPLGHARHRLHLRENHPHGHGFPLRSVFSDSVAVHSRCSKTTSSLASRKRLATPRRCSRGFLEA